MRRGIPLILLAVSLPMSGVADVIHMTDGRKLEGTVLAREPERLQLKMRYGTVWLDREKIARIVPGPLSWEGKTRPRKEAAQRIDWNVAQRVVFALTRKYQPGLLRGYWDLRVHEELMQQLTIPKLRIGAFRLVPDLLDQVPNSHYEQLYRSYLAYSERELAYWYERAWREARRIRVTQSTRKPELKNLHQELSGWLSSNPEYKNPTRFKEVQLLLKRIAFLDDYQRQLKRWDTPKLLLEQLEDDGRYYQSWLFQIFGANADPKTLIRRAVASATHPRLWLSDFQVTAEGAKKLAAAKAAIGKRIKRHEVDGVEALFDMQGFGSREFRLLEKSDTRHPHLFRLHRYYRDKELLAQHLFVRLGKPVTQMLIPDGKTIWYAPVIKR